MEGGAYCDCNAIATVSSPILGHRRGSPFPLWGPELLVLRSHVGWLRRRALTNKMLVVQELRPDVVREEALRDRPDCIAELGWLADDDLVAVADDPPLDLSETVDAESQHT